MNLSLNYEIQLATSDTLLDKSRCEWLKISLQYYSLVEMGASRAPPGIFNETNFF